MVLPRLSVICPYYRRKESIRQTIDSIKDQSFDDFVAIVWDDCSPDSTWDELERYVLSLNDSRFVAFRNNSNLGLSRGLNKAINMTDTDYIAVVGSGDICHRDRLAKQVAELDTYPDAVFCATDSDNIDPSSGEVFRDHIFTKTIIELSDLESVVPYTHGSVMFRRSALNQVGLYEECFEWCADWDLFLRLLKIGSARYIPEILYTRYAFHDGVSFNPDKSLSQIRHKYLALALKENINEARRKEMLVQVHEKGLPFAVRQYNKLIVRDLGKRIIKLALMKRFNQAERLNKIVINEYGYSFARQLAIFVTRLLSYIPVDMSNTINVLREISKSIRMG